MAFCVFQAMLYGLTSCLMMGCGPAYIVQWLIPFLGTASGELDLKHPAILFYGLGAVLGDIPVYIISKELFKSTRIRLSRNRCDNKVLTTLHGYLSDHKSGCGFLLMIALSVLNPLPIDFVAIVAAMCGTSLVDFLCASLIGKGLLRTQFIIYLFSNCSTLTTVTPMKEHSKVLFGVCLTVLLLGASWYRKKRDEIEIDSEDE
eukprot:TRINITY_DN2300_c5_g1_i1.p1 TRINITY_DN2300_c5_g1~~TRINITY_DN2300_c5_g1_i1.p1  ORF type:complete len:203 (+),score=18.12 TRINITY_DN2300_c5_g1_i1:103-711(+)